MNQSKTAGSFVLKYAFVFLLFSMAFVVKSQEDTRTQYPLLLNNAYFEINIGYIDYNFTQAQILDQNYVARNVLIPHTAVRIIPFGYRINKYLSAQISYMRPVLWVRYQDVTNINDATDVANTNAPVYMNIGGVTLKGTLPVSSKFSLLGEAGLGVITRTAMFHSTRTNADGSKYKIMEKANYGTFLLGTGVKYHLNNNWNFMASMAYSPTNEKNNQPATIFYGGGFAFNMGTIPNERIKEKEEAGYLFPRNIIEVGYTTNALGYGVNNFFAEGVVPVFWGGAANIKNGFTVHYQRNSFHGEKIFSLDWGTSVSYGKSEIEEDKFLALSLYPMFRFTLIRTKYANLFINYSLAGPTYYAYLSGGRELDGVRTGPEFTFQDFMGVGGYFGKTKNIVFEARITHYSNGNIFPDNPGIKVPLSFNLGYAF